MSSMVLRDGQSDRYLGWIETPSGLGNFGMRTSIVGEVDFTSLRMDAVLAPLVSPVCREKWFLDRLKVCKTPMEYVEELQKIVDMICKEANERHNNDTRAEIWSIANSICSPAFAQWICDAVAVVGYDKVERVESDFSVLSLRSVDASGRVHPYSVSFRSRSSLVAPRVDARLPVAVDFNWRGDGSPNSLKDISLAVEKLVSKYEPFFTVLDDVSARCRVLEPLNPTYASCFRRIGLDASCSVTVTINPLNPRAMCDMTFMGPVAATMELKQSVARNAHAWDERTSFINNLEHVLGVSVLPKEQAGDGTEGGQVEGAECGICYSFQSPEEAEVAGGRRDDADTDVICANERCARRYHRQCLVGWLQSVPSSRTSFGTMFGACPYCSESISVRAGR